MQNFQCSVVFIKSVRFCYQHHCASTQIPLGHHNSVYFPGFFPPYFRQQHLMLFMRGCFERPHLDFFCLQISFICLPLWPGWQGRAFPGSQRNSLEWLQGWDPWGQDPGWAFQGCAAQQVGAIWARAGRTPGGIGDE